MSLVIPLALPDATLRPVRTGDEADVQLCCNDLQLAQDVGSSFPHPYTIEHARDFVEFASKSDGPFQRLAVTRHDHIVGMMGIVSTLTPTCAYAEIGYWTGRHATGAGFATEGLKTFCTYAFSVFPQLNRLEALTYAHNIASQRVLEKAGFVREAVLKGRARNRDGVIVDDVMFARLRSN